MLIKGNLGAGKTTYLIKKYGELISKGVKSSEILVICQNSFLRDKFIEKLKGLGLSGGSFPVYTFSGLAYRSILNNWPLFEQIIPANYGESVVSPDMVGVNITSYVLKKNIDRVDLDDYQAGQNLMHQLLRRYALISSNALSPEEVAQKSALLGETFAADAKKALDLTKADMLKYRTFDYLRQTEAFMKLFSEGAISDFDGVKYLLVDDFDEMTYQAFLFVSTLSQKVSEYHIAFDEFGGARRGYLCAYPDGWKSFKSEVLELTSLLCDSDKILSNFTEKEKQKLESLEFNDSEQNIEMIDAVLGKITALIEKGVDLSDIKIVTPELDSVLKNSLENYFLKNDVKYQFLSGTKRLYDDKFVFVSLLILCLVHPEWNLRVQESEIKRLLVEFLGLPLISCDGILKHYKKNAQLPIITDLGEDEIVIYNDLIALIENLKLKKSSLTNEMMCIFKEFILDNATDEDTFSFFNQLFVSLDDFEKLYSKISAEIPYRDWVLQVKSSVVSDNPTDIFEVKADALIISTPQKLIDFELRSEYQIWVDGKNRSWLKDDIGVLYNSWVYQKNFTEDEYSQKLHSELTLKKIGHMLRKLKFLCNKVSIFSSDFGVSSSENKGELLNYLIESDSKNSCIKSIQPREDQKPVLEYTKGKMAVPAVPGAGKTTIMQALIMKLIDDGISPSAILVLTYMESAAKNFAERIKQNYPNLGDYPHISTIHGLAFKVISEGNNANRVGLDVDFEVCDEVRNSAIVNKICLDNLPAGEDFSDWVDYNKRNISKAKMLLLSPSDIQVMLIKNPDSQIQEFLYIYKAYNKALRRANLVDYDDLLILAYKLLAEHQDIRAYYQNKFEYVIEDEAQDSSRIQQQLIELIAQKSGNIVRCGDVNQAIMSTFTNSDLQGFYEFIKSAHTVEMKSSQRCAKEIYELANSLVEWAKTTNEYKDAFYNIKMQPVEGTNPKEQDCLTFESFEYEASELEFVLSEIKKLKEQDKSASIVILLRNNYQLRNWINFLEKNGIEVLCRADEIKEKKVFKLCLSILKFINNPFDNKLFADLAVTFNHCNLARISNISIDFVKKLKEPIIKNEELLHSAKELDNSEMAHFWWDVFYFLNKSHNKMDRFIFDFGRYYFSKSQDISNVNLISSMIKRFEQSFVRDMEREPLLQDVIKYLEQIGKARGVKYFSDAEETFSAVEIMTLHKSKGDEFDAVFIPQFVDKFHNINIEKITLRKDDTLSLKLEKLAGKGSQTKEGKQKESAFEALRLIYVAITRAKKRIYFTNAKEGNEVFDLLKKLSGGVKV